MAQTRHQLIDYFVDGQMLAPPVVQGDIPYITADWEWWNRVIEKNQAPVTVSALQRGAWQAKDGRIVQIFVNVSDQTIHFNRPNADGADQQKTSLAAYSVKIIRSNKEQ